MIEPQTDEGKELTTTICKLVAFVAMHRLQPAVAINTIDALIARVKSKTDADQKRVSGWLEFFEEARAAIVQMRARIN